MNPVQKSELREQFYGQAETVNVEGYDYMGRIVEGLLFQNGDGQSVTVKVIVKNENFDVDDALEEFADKEKARAEKEEAKAKKLAKVKAEKEAKQKAE